MSQQDKTFVHEAGAGNLAEVEPGQLAEQKAADPAVREFGRWMATDHGFAQQVAGRPSCGKSTKALSRRSPPSKSS